MYVYVCMYMYVFKFPGKWFSPGKVKKIAAVETGRSLILAHFGEFQPNLLVNLISVNPIPS
jgi:hypothetical protein